MDLQIEKNSYMRTVIVIDHGSEFSKLSGTRVDVEGGSKHRSNQSSVGSLMKMMWTIIAEGAVEYCRIVYDVLPEDVMVLQLFLQLLGSNSRIPPLILKF